MGSAAAWAMQQTSPAQTREPPLCTDQLPPRAVKLVYVDVAPGVAGPVVTPELCVVRSGTQVVWRKSADAQESFELTFAEAPGGTAATQFLSRPVGNRQEVLITAKPVTSTSEIPYDARIGVSRIDPGIKIVPR
ncbi:hypothetical protein ARC78_06255 [Stenotrophomonas pictorum JCM 9942]|uniref:Uncharacterized protein n=2 Tax=Stenotrophomonas pictorum TaxID=86184 RepID=A0A0R0AID7_9GAMM|nr:hypothetical protein ARC78_06255 [Stenotrophomonas pictorum JCM 9942]